MLRILSDKKKHLFYRQNTGRTERVIFENKITDGKISGFTDNYVRVVADFDPQLINSSKEVRLASVTKDGFVSADISVPS